MKCEAINCKNEAEYSRNITVTGGFGVEIQLCKMHYLVFVPYSHMLTVDAINAILGKAVEAPSILD